jgi:hypothetical protein
MGNSEIQLSCSLKFSFVLPLYPEYEAEIVHGETVFSRFL